MGDVWESDGVVVETWESSTEPGVTFTTVIREGDIVTGGSGVDLSDATPAALGTAAPGVGTEASRADHVHGMPTAADVGAAASSRSITAGSGLSGGGDLTDDRTISADFGSGAGKVTEGNDARLSDARTPTAHAASHGNGGADEVSLDATQITTGTVAQARLGTGSAGAGALFLADDQTWKAAGGSETLPASIIDAKGDLIVGTAADTAARLDVGSNGQVLTADSTATGGVKWAAASPPRKAGSYYLNGMAGGNFTPTLNQLYLTPLPIQNATISAIAMQVVLNGGAGSVVRLGLYAWDDGEPSGPPIVDAGTVSATSAGVKEVAITPIKVAHACLAIVWQGGTPNAVAGLSATGSQVGGILVGSPTAILATGSFPATCWTVSGVTGALPTISSLTTQGDFTPRIIVKVG